MMTNPHDLELKGKYINYKNKLGKLISKAKRAYAQKEISRNNNKSKGLWDSVNEICNKTKAKTEISKIKVGNTTIFDKKILQMPLTSILVK